MPEGSVLPRTDATRALRKAETCAAPAQPSAPSVAAVAVERPQPPAALERRRLLNYELGDQIGAGGMGTVLRAKHLWLNRTVAIKFISPQVLQNNEAVERFRHECRAIGALDHPNIVRATDAGEVEDLHYLVTEFVAGDDLAALVTRGGRLEVADACEAIRQAALGLQHAHDHGLVHRDVKPSNLLLDQTGTIKLLDFGLARMLAGQTTLTSTGQVLGTLDFLAPEQASDARSADPRSDQYSLGCTLYFLLAGAPPFSGPAYDSAASKLKAHLIDQPRPVTELRRKLPLALVAVLERMMAKSPADRFASVHDAALALEPLCQGADLCLLSGGAFNPLSTHRTRHRPQGLLAGCGEIAERCAAVLGWAIRGAVSSRNTAAASAPRRPLFSLGGLALLACLGFVLSHFSCVPIDDPAAFPPGADGFRVVEFGFGPGPDGSLPVGPPPIGPPLQYVPKR